MTPTAAPAVTWKISTDWLGSEKKKESSSVLQTL